MDTKIFDDRVDEARRAYMVAHDATKAAVEAERKAFEAWGEARIAKAEYVGVHVPGEPLKYIFSEGDRVVREDKVRINDGFSGFTRSGKTRKINQRGVITLCRITKERNYAMSGKYRNHDPIAGEWFVLSPNGATAYKLDATWKPDEAK